MDISSLPAALQHFPDVALFFPDVRNLASPLKRRKIDEAVTDHFSSDEHSLSSGVGR